ncbi:MAG: hypothetical protein P8Q97_15420 [Myxococcota bacterium]|jgi:hypothetical protein|nr:hypothetical protein [Myxococcota bacterium]
MSSADWPEETGEGEGAGPPRVASLPFFYTAPIAMTIAGGLLLNWGALALSTPWSSLTLALTHVMTLGFLTMTGLGGFYALAARSGLASIAKTRRTHFVYYSLLVGVVGLVWGTASAQSTPVFIAIGAMGLAVSVFVFEAGRVVRGVSGAHRGVRALRLALWGFGLATFLGVWLAHGHGGMRFPGLRSLWMQVHLCIALLGWLGGMLVALSGVALPTNFGAPGLSDRSLDTILGGTALGIFPPFLLLLFGYFFVPSPDQGWIEPWAMGLLAPAALAIWFVHPVLGLSALAGGRRGPGLRHWQLGLGLAPLVLGVGVVAWAQQDLRLGMLFGWLAIFGWAGTLFSGLLLGTLPGLLSPLSSEGSVRLTRAAQAGLLSHAAALVAGAVGIVAQSDAWCRAAGGLVLADGLWLLVVLIWAMMDSRSSSSSLPSP